MSFASRPLGRTGITVFPIGIGGGYSLSRKDLDYACDRGVNCFFWGPVFPTYFPMTRWLGTDYLDLFHLGWIRSKDEKALEILLEIKDKGRIRHLAISAHNRRLAACLANEWPVDVVMIRYNHG